MTQRMSASEFRAAKAPSRYRNKRTLFNGRLYHSKAEAEFAQRLELERYAGEVLSWEPQYPFVIRVNGVHVTTYRADFLVNYSDGRSTVYDVKGARLRGAEASRWRLIRKLMLACFGITIEEIRAKR